MLALKYIKFCLNIKTFFPLHEVGQTGGKDCGFSAFGYSQRQADPKLQLILLEQEVAQECLSASMIR